MIPEDLIAEIIGERLQLSDCYKGVIIDGLESCFMTNQSVAMQAVLKGTILDLYVNQFSSMTNLFFDNKILRNLYALYRT